MLALAGASIESLIVVSNERPSEVRAKELSYLPKGEYLRIAVLGYRQIAADLIWMRAIQHFGGRKATISDYLWAYHAVDVLTDLDPKFAFAYQAAGTILAVWANHPRESAAILTKGMLHNPEVWQLPFYLGYDYYYELNDPIAAGKYFRIAALLPGSPAYLPRLAARMTVEAGDPDAALEFLQRLHQQTRDEQLREGLVRRIKEVMAERDIRILESAVKRYRTTFGKLPVNLQDLVARGIITQIPVEPFGGTYQVKVEDGTIISTGFSERLRVHRH